MDAPDGTDTLGDLMARERRSERPALRVDAGDRTRTYHDLCTTAWKTSNALRHCGVAPGRRVALAADPAPQVVFGLLGAWLLGAAATVAEPGEVDARVVIAPTDVVEAYDLPPGGQRVAYGDRPTDPSISHFGTLVWSENPGVPASSVAPDDPALAGDDETYDHRAVLDAAAAAADALALDADDAVAVRSPLACPGTVVAGVVAPLLVGATVLFPDRRDDVRVDERSSERVDERGSERSSERADERGTERGDAAVADGDAPESRVLSPGGVFG